VKITIQAEVGEEHVVIHFDTETNGMDHEFYGGHAEFLSADTIKRLQEAHNGSDEAYRAVCEKAVAEFVETAAYVGPSVLKAVAFLAGLEADLGEIARMNVERIASGTTVPLL
jgi:hypothetical protein